MHRAVVGAQRRDGTVIGVLHLLALHLQVADPHADGGVAGPPDPQEALGLLVPGVGGARHAGNDGAVRLHPVPGEQHPELPSDAVLGRGPAVGVEEVALVEDGVGDGTQLLEGAAGPFRRLFRQARCGSALAAALDQSLRHRASSSVCAHASLPPRSHRSLTPASSGPFGWAVRGGEVVTSWTSP